MIKEWLILPQSQAIEDVIHELCTLLSGCHQEVCECVVIAANECLINSIVEMNTLALEEPLLVKLEIQADSIIFSVTDYGRGIKEAQLKQPLMPETSAELGRGLAMIDILVDSFDMSINADGSKTYTLKKLKGE